MVGCGGMRGSCCEIEMNIVWYNTKILLLEIRRGGEGVVVVVIVVVNSHRSWLSGLICEI